MIIILKFTLFNEMPINFNNLPSSSIPMMQYLWANTRLRTSIIIIISPENVTRTTRHDSNFTVTMTTENLLKMKTKRYMRMAYIRIDETFTYTHTDVISRLFICFSYSYYNKYSAEFFPSSSSSFTSCYLEK